MKSQEFNLIEYVADEGKVFDWLYPKEEEILNEDGEPEIKVLHLYVKKLFIGKNDDIKNYIEVNEPKQGGTD